MLLHNSSCKNKAKIRIQIMSEKYIQYICVCTEMYSLPRACAEQNFALSEVFNSECHLAETLLGQVWRVCDDNVKALRKEILREAQRVVVIIKDKLISIYCETSIKLQQNSRHTIRPHGFQPLQLLIHTWCTYTSYPAIQE